MIFIFPVAIKTAESGVWARVGRVSRNTGILVLALEYDLAYFYPPPLYVLQKILRNKLHLIFYCCVYTYRIMMRFILLSNPPRTYIIENVFL